MYCALGTFDQGRRELRRRRPDVPLAGGPGLELREELLVGGVRVVGEVVDRVVLLEAGDVVLVDVIRPVVHPEMALGRLL